MPRSDGHCNCTDCRPRPVARNYNRVAAERDKKPEPIDSDNFWDKVHEHSKLRDLDRQTRR